MAATTPRGRGEETWNLAHIVGRFGGVGQRRSGPMLATSSPSGDDGSSGQENGQLPDVGAERVGARLDVVQEPRVYPLMLMP